MLRSETRKIFGMYIGKRTCNKWILPEATKLGERERVRLVRLVYIGVDRYYSRVERKTEHYSRPQTAVSLEKATVANWQVGFKL